MELRTKAAVSENTERFMVWVDEMRGLLGKVESGDPERLAGQAYYLWLILDNWAARIALTRALRAHLTGLADVSPAVLAQNMEYRTWMTWRLRERAAVLKVGMSPVMTEEELLDLNDEVPF